MEEGKVETTPQGEDELAAVDKSKSLTVDELKNLIQKDMSLKSWFDSEKDKHHSKAMNTYKTNGNFEKDFEKYGIEKGFLPNPDKPATEDEIERSKELEKKIEIAEKNSQYNDRILKMDELLNREGIKGWNREIVKLLVRDEGMDDNDMSEIVSALRQYDEMNIGKFKKDIPQVTDKNKVENDEILTHEEFINLPYKQRIELLKDNRYKIYTSERR